MPVILPVEDPMFPIVEVVALILFIAGLAWLAVEIVFRDPRGAATMLRDSEKFARDPAPPIDNGFGATMPKPRSRNLDLLSDYRPFI